MNVIGLHYKTKMKHIANEYNITNVESFCSDASASKCLKRKL